MFSCFCFPVQRSVILSAPSLAPSTSPSVYLLPWGVSLMRCGHFQFADIMHERLLQFPSPYCAYASPLPFSSLSSPILLLSRFQLHLHVFRQWRIGMAAFFCPIFSFTILPSLSVVLISCCVRPSNPLLRTLILRFATVIAHECSLSVVILGLLAPCACARALRASHLPWGYRYDPAATVIVVSLTHLLSLSRSGCVSAMLWHVCSLVELSSRLPVSLVIPSFSSFFVNPSQPSAPNRMHSFLHTESLPISFFPISFLHTHGVDSTLCQRIAPTIVS